MHSFISSPSSPRVRATMSPSRAVARLLILCLGAALSVTFVACATSPQRARIENKWEVTTPARPVQPGAQITPAARLQAAVWKRIVPGRTKRSEVESRFGKGLPSAGWFLYRIDQITTLINYSSDNTVQVIRLPAAVELDQQTIIVRYGKPSRERKSDSLL